MKKIQSLTAITLCLALGLGACSPKADEEHKTAAEKKIEAAKDEKKKDVKEYQEKLDQISPAAYRDVSGLNLEPGSYISIIGKKSSGEYWEQVEAGAKQAAADINALLGYEGKDRVRVDYSGPSTAGKVDEQVNILDEELARYPTGVGISIIDAQSCEVQFDLAAANGIPIVAFDSASDYQGLMATVSTDNVGTGQMAADKMAEMMGGTGEIVIFAENTKSMSIEERQRGFTEQIGSEYPQISVSGVYYMDSLEQIKRLIVQEEQIGITGEAGSYEGAVVDEAAIAEITDEEALDYILEKHPDVAGCFATDGTTVKKVTDALARAEKANVTVVAYDGMPEEIEALEDGKIDGLVVQNPFGMGYASVVAAARAALNMGNEAYIDTGVTWMEN